MKNTDNSLYEQLKIDLKENKNGDRIYIPTPVFKNPEKLSPHNITQDEPENDDIVKMLGLLSVLFPILAIVALILGKGYNSKNNYGNSKDMKIGMVCAKVVLGVNIGIILLGLIVFGIGVSLMSGIEPIII